MPLIKGFHDNGRAVPQRPGFLSTSALQNEPQGGDVNLSVMPPDLVSACRAAWAALEMDSETVIHGDLSSGNVVICPDVRFALIDWDESRRDLTGFDLVHRDGIDRNWQRAHLPWEIACGWTVEPVYARSLAAQLMAQY
ncbi:MAG: phosphotransferase [Roseobacter sp.]